MTTPRRTIEAVDSCMESKQGDNKRHHLGASVIGGDCKRSIWYSFRWATTVKHKAQTLRIFDRGHREEERVVKWLRDAGIEVHAVNPETGKQFSFKEFGGHFSGSVDGFAIGVPDLPAQWCLLEFKTHNKKSFAEFEKKTLIEAKPQHFAQIQIYMMEFKLDACLYIAVCKDDDALYMEIVRHDAAISAAMIERARSIIFDEQTPARASNDSTWYRCKWCEHSEICHGEKMPEKSCRSCAHSTAEMAGDWSCDFISGTGEKTDCGDCSACPLWIAHPILVNMAVNEMSKEGHWIDYRSKNGEIIRSGRNPTEKDVPF